MTSYFVLFWTNFSEAEQLFFFLRMNIEPVSQNPTFLKIMKMYAEVLVKNNSFQKTFCLTYLHYAEELKCKRCNGAYFQEI